MSNEQPTFGSGTEMKIDISTPQQLLQWANALKVTPEALQQAVEEVGPMVGDICRKLHV